MENTSSFCVSNFCVSENEKTPNDYIDFLKMYNLNDNNIFGYEKFEDQYYVSNDDDRLIEIVNQNEYKEYEKNDYDLIMGEYSYFN